MSKRQRRRVNKRRTSHMEQVKHRAGLVPRLSIAVAAVAVPAIAAPARAGRATSPPLRRIRPQGRRL